MLPAYLGVLGCVVILIIYVAVLIARSGRSDPEAQAASVALATYLQPVPVPKGFQVGDRVIVVRNLDDDSDTVDDFKEVYGRIGEVVACRSDARNSIYEYYVKFEGWDD